MLPLLIILLACVFIGILTTLWFVWWAVKKEKEMDNNIPTGASDPAYEKEVKMKECKACGGVGYDPTYQTDSVPSTPCFYCCGEGEVELSFEEIVEDRERKMENQSNL